MPDIPADAWPAGDRIVWDDDATRTHHDFLDETTRDYDDDEHAAADARLEAATAAANGDRLESDVSSALVGNRTYLALASPTGAQTTAQVRALTRQVNALARLALGDLSGTD